MFGANYEWLGLCIVPIPIDLCAADWAAAPAAVYAKYSKFLFIANGVSFVPMLKRCIGMCMSEWCAADLVCGVNELEDVFAFFLADGA